MMIRCSRHGDQLGVLMSPDLAELADQGAPAGAHRTLEFEHRGKTVHRMIISGDFSQAEAVAPNRALPLPDDYPDWFNKLVPVCEICATTSLRGS